MIGGSPSPFEPRFVRCVSGLSTNSHTISGTSAIVGIRYASSVDVSTRPVSGSSSRSSENVWPIPWMIPPSTWLEAPSGLTIRPTSWIAATRSTTTSPVSTSTATSTTWTPNVRTLIPVGFGPRAPLPRIWRVLEQSTTSCTGASRGRPRCSAMSSICSRASAAAARTAGPIDGSVDEPAEMDAYGPRAESPRTTSTRSSGSRSSSAAICAIAVLRARADVLHRRDHGGAAVGADPHPGVRGRPAAAVPDLRRHPDAALPHGVRPRTHLVAPLPVRLGALVALLELLRRDRRPLVRHRVVAAAQLERIHVELCGELVDDALEPERPLDEARRTERLHRRRVDLRAVRLRADVLAVVEHLHRALGGGVPARPADGVRELAVERDDRPVAARAGAEPLDRRVAVARGGVLVAARERAAHGPPRPLSKLGGDERVLVRPVLRAEAAAHELAHDAHLVRRHLERLGDGVAHAPDELRRDVDVEDVARPLADRLVRLHRVVEDGLRAVRRLDDDVGLRERLLDVAALVVARVGRELARGGRLRRGRGRSRAPPTRSRSRRARPAPGGTCPRRRRRPQRRSSRPPPQPVRLARPERGAHARQRERRREVDALHARVRDTASGGSPPAASPAA